MLDLLADLLTLPRALGHPERSTSIDILAGRLRDLGLETIVQPFEARDPQPGITYALSNVVGTFQPNASRRFVLATHFDTRPWADEDADPAAHSRPVPGANDGTSGLAVTLALAEVLPDALPHDVGFTVVLFDGEELGHPGDLEAYCAGSRYLASQPRKAGDRAFAAIEGSEFGLVLDMVGDADLQILPEPNSRRFNPWLVDHIFSVAERDGFDAFDATAQSPGIIDDHTFLTEAGVPSVLLIDYTYPPWHTRADTIDAVSEASLDAVFEVVLRSLTEAFAPDRDGAGR